MAEFKVNVNKVRETSREQSDITKQMRRLEEEVLHIQNHLSFEIAQKRQIRQKFKRVRGNITGWGKDISDAAKALNQIADIYENTEAGLAGNVVAGSVLEPLTNLSDIQNLRPQAVIPDIDKITKPCINPGLLVLKDLITDGIKKGLIIDPIKIFESKKDEKTWYSENKDKLKDSDIPLDELKEIAGIKWGSSLLHSEGTAGDKDGTHASYTMDALKQEAHAEIYGGLFYTDPETGEKRLRVAAGVAAGYTMTAFTSQQEAQLGNDRFGAYVKAEETVGKVGAEASAVFGLHDKDGNFNPSLHAKASLEAIALEASVKGGVKVLGADVGVKGSVNVGVGAHAEFGYKDGKFSADIGASLGIGASVKLEIDIGGMVDTVADAAQAVWTGIMGLF